MKQLLQYTILSLLIFICAANTQLAAQSCEYTLQMHDSFGDGWNEANLTVSINGVATTYTLEGFPGNGEDTTYTLIVQDGQSILLEYQSGFWESEVTYELLDADGIILFSDGPYPQVGSVFTGTVDCPTCPALTGITTDARATTCEIRWLSSVVGSTTAVRYKLSPGGAATTVTSTTNHVTLTGLMESETYEYEIFQICTPGDTSALRGPFYFNTVWANDVGIVGLVSPETACELSNQETLHVQLKNFGGNPQTLVTYRYSIDGVLAAVPVPFDGFFTGVVGKDSVVILAFETTGNFSTPGDHEVKIWTELDGDQAIDNDTFTTIVRYDVSLLPVEENFNDSSLPSDWTNDSFWGISDDHGNTTPVLFSELWAGTPSWEVTTNNVGFIATGDSLIFDYRIVDWPSGDAATSLSGSDKVFIQISKDCGETYQNLYTIGSNNHITSTDMRTIKFGLQNFVGEAIILRIKAQWGEGDYFVDIDNINITGCPYDFDSDISIEQPTNNLPNGSIAVEPTYGEPPFTYVWSNNVTTTINTLTDLASGTYHLTLSDSNGCSQVYEIMVSAVSGTTDFTSLSKFDVFPNPTQGSATVDIQFVTPMHATIQIINTIGQVVWQHTESNITNQVIPIDMQMLPNGMYFVRLSADDKQVLKKLIKATH